MDLLRAMLPAGRHSCRGVGSAQPRPDEPWSKTVVARALRVGVLPVRRRATRVEAGAEPERRHACCRRSRRAPAVEGRRLASPGPGRRRLSNRMATWQKARAARAARLQAGATLAKGKIVQARDATALLEAVIRPGDRVSLEGDNQKQADLLAAA